VRFFNTAGVCFPDRHYMVPAEPRLQGARRLIDQGQYFVVHAPRQTGKTTSLLALAQALTAEGRYAAVYTTCETGRAAGDDYVAAQRSVLSVLRSQAQYGLPEPLRPRHGRMGKRMIWSGRRSRPGPRPALARL
jgi:hypothetical protein